MAAIREACFLTDIGQVIIREQQQIFRFGHADIFNIFFAGAAVKLAEFFCKEGITHIAHGCQILYFKRLVGMCINIFCDRVYRIILWLGCQHRRCITVISPDTHHGKQQAGQGSMHGKIIAVISVFVFTGTVI